MQGHDLIVIGASAGGVEALTALVAGLPANLPAAVCVVVHIPATNVSVLPKILARAGVLPAKHPVDGEMLQKGRIYVAPPDRHLLIRAGTLRLGHGPRENGHRPAADPLFRSAARQLGPRVIGVVLSGGLDDGTAGLQAVKACGGIAVVQDPSEALAPGMPRSAVEQVAVDYVVPIAEMGPLLVRLATDPAPEGVPPVSREMEKELQVARLDENGVLHPGGAGPPSEFVCPECGGTLYEIDEGNLLRFRCRVGHAYGPDSLGAEQGRAIEEAMWSALRALEERAALCRRMIARTNEHGLTLASSRYEQQARDADEQAALIRNAVQRRAAVEAPGEPEAPEVPTQESA